jgi:transposase
VSSAPERLLLASGERVVRVPPKLMAGARRGARQRGKSDAIDALAVARAALREPELPIALLEGSSREIRLLLDHREDLVGERTRAQNRLRWHLHELEPELELPAGALDRRVWLERIARRLAGREQTAQVRNCRELVRRIGELTRRARELGLRVAAEAPALSTRRAWRCTPAPPRCQPRAASANATGSTAPATASSTARSIASPSCKDSTTPPCAPASSARRRKARAAGRRCAA